MLTGILIWFIGPALLFAVAEMALTGFAARRLNNYGIVDIVWAAGFSGLVLLYDALFYIGHKIPTPPKPPMWLLSVLVCMWSMRLATHLFVRVRKHHPVEDVRYAKLRHDWCEQTPQKMVLFFQLQGLLQVLLSLPFLLVCLDAELKQGQFGLAWNHWLGTAFWFAGLLGESLADRQLARFRADPANKGKVCHTGLWNYSRHPNYFFEWLVWVGYAVFALGSPWGWLGLLAPALMLHFLLNVTGIPMTEELSLKSKGDAYRAYQRTTSAFVPWFKKPTANTGGSGH